jgi:serine phosphatase RsbU (regulator of sigma subunit)
MKLTVTRLTLAPGETLVYFTDGLTEPFGPDGQTMFGLEGLKAALGGPAASDPLETRVENVRAALRRFTGSAELQDDQTLLLLRRS